jgi:CheY-like chemotaxis protein
VNSVRTVLLIEDDPDVSETLAGLLARFDYAVTIARDGQKALRALRDGPLPRLILLDLMMPNMDGHRFRNAQLEEPTLAAIPTIVITADAKASREKLGVAACFRKPFDVEALLNEIARHF